MCLTSNYTATEACSRRLDAERRFFRRGFFLQFEIAATETS